MSLNNILFKWFLSLFTQNVSEEISKIIWDSFFLQGHIVLFKTAIGMLRLIEKKILQSQSLEEIMEIFDHCSVDEEITEKKIKFYLLVKRYDFDISIVKNNRMLVMPKVKEKIRNIAKSRKKEDCDASFPFCAYGTNKLGIKDFFIYKPIKGLAQVKVIDDYFFRGKKKDTLVKRRSCKNLSRKVWSDIEKFTNFETLLIDRQKHICGNIMKISLSMKDLIVKKKKKFNYDFSSRHIDHYKRGNKLVEIKQKKKKSYKKKLNGFEAYEYSLDFY